MRAPLSEWQKIKLIHSIHAAIWQWCVRAYKQLIQKLDRRREEALLISGGITSLFSSHFKVEAKSVEFSGIQSFHHNSG